jgi:hypothetical protein
VSLSKYSGLLPAGAQAPPNRGDSTLPLHTGAPAWINNGKQRVVTENWRFESGASFKVSSFKFQFQVQVSSSKLAFFSLTLTVQLPDSKLET